MIEWKHRLAPVAIVLCSIALIQPTEARPFVSGADDLEVTVGGAVQPRISYGHSDQVMVTDRVGFGLRRARTRISGTWGMTRVEADLDFATMSAVQLYATLKLSDNWRMRAGYFPGAQPQAYIPTSMTKIDGVERAAIAERWSRLTIGSSGRDLGVDLKWSNDYAYASVWLHSGLGSLNRSGANYRESPSSHNATRGVDNMALAISGSLGFTPQDGLELGGYVGYNAAGGARAELTPGIDRTVTSWSAHVYWGPDPGSQFLRLKAEALGIMIEGDDPPAAGGPPPQVDLSHFGAAGTAAIGIIPHGEVFARFEVFDEDDGNDLTRYLSTGVMFSPSAMDGGPFARERITLLYSNAVRGEQTDHIAVLQGQWLF